MRPRDRLSMGLRVTGKASFMGYQPVRPGDFMVLFARIDLFKPCAAPVKHSDFLPGLLICLYLHVVVIIDFLQVEVSSP